MTTPSELFNGYYPIQEVPQYSFEAYRSWYEGSIPEQLALYDDPYLGEGLRKYVHQQRTSDDDTPLKPWYRAVVKHPMHDTWVNGFDTAFPGVYEAIRALPITNLQVSILITPGSLETVETQHFDANCGEDISLRAYLVIDSAKRLFFRKLKPAYEKYYRSARGTYLNVRESHCYEPRNFIKTWDCAHIWALDNRHPHGFDYIGNPGRVTLIISGNVDDARTKELILRTNPDAIL